MALERVAGRDANRAHWEGFPVGCVGRDQASTICSANLSSDRKCAICIRRGDFPLPVEWRGACEAEHLERQSVQVVRTALPSLPWAVIVFIEGRMVDGRFPIIGAADPDDAIDLALARVAQLKQGARIDREEAGRWRAGGTYVLASAAAGKGTRWRSCRA